MTPDELITRIHRQRAELVATEIAMDALMTALPPEVQKKWIAALQSLQSSRTAALEQQQMDPLSIAQANTAIDRRLFRLKQAMS